MSEHITSQGQAIESARLAYIPGTLRIMSAVMAPYAPRTNEQLRRDRIANIIVNGRPSRPSNSMVPLPNTGELPSPEAGLRRVNL